MMYSEMAVGHRKVRARVPYAGGGLRKGNSRTVNTAPLVPLGSEPGPAWHGDSTVPPAWLLDRMADQTMTAGYTKRRNPVCPGCGIMVPTSRHCDNCWD